MIPGNQTHRISWLIIVAGLFLVILGGAVVAQRGSGLTIEPIYQEITIPGKTDNRYFVKLTNNTDRAQNFRLKTADFGSLDETGGVAFLGITQPDVNYKYGLTRWLSLDQEFIALAAGQTHQIDFAITKIDTLTPGGHYGAILVMPDTGANRIDESRVQISPVVSSLIFLKKIGGDISSLELKSAAVGRAIFNPPNKVDLRFHNGGNVHLVPRGTVMLTDRTGKVVSEGLINAESGFVLPETNRRYVTSMRQTAAGWWPGHYNLNINYRYDGNDNFQTQTVKVFYMGRAAILGLIGLVLLIILWLAKKYIRRK